MAKISEPAGQLKIHLQVGSEYEEVTVDAVAFVGPLAVHETVADHRLADAKSAAYSVTHTATGMGVVNGVQTKKLALAFAEEALAKAQELGLDLSAPSYDPGLFGEWCSWAFAARAELKTRKGFLYD